MLRRFFDPAARGRPARDASASRPRTTADAPRSLRRRRRCLCLLRQPLFVRFLHILIAPVDDRLGAQLDEILLELVAALVGDHALADLLASLVELENLRRRRRLEL